MPSWLIDALMNPFVELGLIIAMVSGLLAISNRREQRESIATGQRPRPLWRQAMEGMEFIAPQPASLRSPTLHSSGDASPAPLRLRQWLNRLNQQPDRHPHLIATGPTGSGKTTLVLAVLADRPGRVVITTPKSRKADPWGGLPVIRLRHHDMSFAPIQQTIMAVYGEMLRRNAQEADVEDDWLTLVIDEYPTVRAKCKGIEEQVLDMLRLARSVRIRLILLSTETTVDALGLKGNGDARQNCLFVELDEDRQGQLYRWGKDAEPLDTSGVLMASQWPIPTMRWWTPPTPYQVLIPPQESVRRRDRVSTFFLEDREQPRRTVPAHPVETAQEKVPATELHFPASESDSTVSDLDFSAEEIAQIGALIGSGRGKTEVVKAMPRYSGRKHSLYSVYYDRMLTAVHQILDSTHQS